ncbi:MAG TPA: phosphoribosylformylglycinamidine synthase subunit PurL, partial [Dehalococcoidia bacterium]|nr:phosphoribosylformylglycinamidine synthase subunit PurL [Dehalococcoidia bacterium]
DEAYAANPLVNAMCVGIARSDKLLRAIATGAGNPIILVGADTGRDGIGGANVLASRTFEAGQEELRPTVQVGNPFLEKLLMEACVELAEHHADWIVGLQDCGAAGLTSSLVECAARGDSGIEIDIQRVPRRETGMTAAEVMLSESQERMIVIARKEHEADVMAHFRRWEIHCDVIGQVTDDGIVRIRDGDEEYVRVPARIFTDAPEYRRQGVKPRGLDELQTYDLAFLPDIVAWEEGPADANAALLQLLASPEITQKRWIWRQYDHQVLTNTVVGPGSDAAVLRIKEAAPRGIAVSTDGDGVKAYLDPFAGGAMAVAEATRNVACTGAKPLAITDCLNFGNPERPDVYFQLEECVRGMAAACETLGVPVISGNVSLYNESDGTAIYPTPVIGALGVLEDVSKAVPSGFQRSSDAVYLLGITTGDGGRDVLPGDPIQLAGSEYLRQFHGKVAGSVRIDLACEARVQRVLVEAAADGLLASAHDCSHGGLAVALAEACLLGETGFVGDGLEIDARRDAALFGETASRVVVSVGPDRVAELEALLERNEVPYGRLGETGGDRLRIAGAIDLPVTGLRDAYEGGLERALTGQS